MQIDHSKSPPTDDKLTLKGARSRQMIHFNFQGSKYNSGITEARIVQFFYIGRLNLILPKDDISPHKLAWLWSRNCFKILQFAVLPRVARVRQRQLSYLLHS